MEDYKKSSNAANSYAERAIYEEIIANLDGYGSDVSEFQLNQQCFGGIKKEFCDEMEDPRLRYIMNDHNYILSERHSCIAFDMRQNLIDYVKKNSESACSSTTATTVEKLIDSVLKLLTKSTDYDTIIEKIENTFSIPQADSIKTPPIADELRDCKTELAEDDLSDKMELSLKDELGLWLKQEENPEINLTEDKPLLPQESDPLPTVNETNNTIVCKREEKDSPETKNNEAEKIAEPSDKDKSPPSEEIKEPETAFAEEPKTLPVEPTETTEPAPSESKEESEPDKNITETPPVINELLTFADKLKEDYANASKNSDFNLETFLALKTREYKSITNSVLLVETSVQTEKVISKKKLRKINAQDKRHLLESSNESDSSASSYIDQTFTELEEEYNSRKPYFSELKSRTSSKDCLVSKKSKRSSKYFRSDSDSEDECGKSETSQFNESLYSLSKDETGNSDQIGNDMEKDKDESKTSNSKVNDKQDPDKSRGKGTNESDKENRSFAVTPEHNSSLKSTDEGFHDKEIERLLNLKGLADPQKNTSLTNNTKTHKSSSKMSSKTDSLYAVMQEIDKNSLSDDSQNEDSEQILTEKQFLVKCNENLKQQLLNSASSESDNFDSDVDNDLIDKSNEHSGDEDEHRLSYVDKFLETLIDTEDNSPVNSEAAKVASPSSIEIPDQNKTDKKDTPPIKNSKTDRDAFGLKKKENTEKTFDGPLSNDKKQKVTIHEDLIDLSGESCNSDVEEFAVEAKEKSQRIKPMLRQDQLESETIYAQKKEAERLRRLEKRNTYLAKMLKCQSDSVKEKDLVLDYTSVNKKFIKVHPEIVKHLKPHQRDGVKFMYDSCYGCVDDLKATSGSGCILAHCMGLGKTLQIIALLHTVTTYKELKTSKILVLCPKSTIMNWADEIQRWLGPLEVKNLQIYNFSDTADIYEKINVLRQWSTSSSMKAGCLIMGYEAFRSLVFYHSHKNRAKSTVRVEEIRKSINKFLLRPGADLVVCDEGHIIKNRKSGISLAAAEIVTPKRIILTGTPIQNNLKEYYSMVNFIKPLILGTEKEFANLYANPIKNGQHKDSSKRDIKVMKQRSFVLHKKLSKCVQRKEAELLQSFLPQKFEYVLFIPMSEVQNNLYEYVLEAISKREDSRGRSLITDYTCLRKIWTHPKVLEDAWKNAMVAKNKKEPKKHIAHSDDDQPDDIYDSQTGAISVQRDWWRGLVTETDLESILPSNKLKTMFEIIRMSEENAFVAVLNVVEYFFNKINDKQRDFFPFERPENSTGHWINGQDYYRLDGKTNKTLRHEMVKRFNDPQNKRARVFLISAKAGGQGINLIGANRVIILDTSWNPANDQQNIFRIFRLGQKKNCYVYRLIAMGTMEEKVYSRSVTKQAMSFRVVDEQQIDRHYSMAELAELYTLTKPCYKERPVPVFPQDQILANLLLNFPDLVYKYHEHDSLLENKVEQELSEQDKADAWVAYERDLQMNSESRDVVEGYHGYPLFGQPNYMGPPGDFDPNNILQGLTQMDMANRNALGSSLIPNYMVNRNSYLDILNMYKNFSSSLLGDKSRNSRFNASYPMSLAQGMMNNPGLCNTLPSTESHLSALNPFYPFNTLASTNSGYPNSSLNTNPMLSHLNLSSSSHNNPERYEPNKNIISVDDNTPPPLRNFPNPMSAFPNDLANISLQPKSRIQNPPAGPSSSPIMNSPTQPPLPQAMFSTSMGKDGIPRNVIPKRRPKLPSKPAIMPSGLTSEITVKSKSKDSLLRSPSPRQSHGGPQDSFMKTFEQPMPVNMGIVYPKPMSLPPSETNEGACIMKSGSSMQIIPTHSQLTESVRKKFDNISPNISLTAVRTLPKPVQPEHLPATSNSSHLDVTSSNVRKRRGSPFVMGNDNEKIYSSANSTPSATEKSTIPPKVSKY